MGQDNRLCRCLTTSKAHIVTKELHKGVVGGHFVVDITIKKILDVRYYGCKFGDYVLWFPKGKQTHLGKFKKRWFGPFNVAYLIIFSF